MTDITDQDRRVAHEWAASIDPEMSCWSDSARAVARVILATVDAPDPALAEELRDVADNYGMSSRAADRLDDIADRVEHDLAEARAKVEQAEDRAAEWQGIAQRDYAKVELFTAHLAEAHAEVERLTAERYEKEVLDAIDANCDHYAAQKGAESNAESLDPADVKPGEAWIVECHGERRPAVKDGDGPIPWNTVTAGGRLSPEYSKAVTLITRLVPAPRVITKPDELDRAKRCTVIRDAAGVVCERDAMGDYWTTFTSLANQKPHIEFPATVLWEPEA